MRAARRRSQPSTFTNGVAGVVTVRTRIDEQRLSVNDARPAEGPDGPPAPVANETRVRRDPISDRHRGPRGLRGTPLRPRLRGLSRSPDELVGPPLHDGDRSPDAEPVRIQLSRSRLFLG